MSRKSTPSAVTAMLPVPSDHHELSIIASSAAHGAVFTSWTHSEHQHEDLMQRTSCVMYSSLQTGMEVMCVSSVRCIAAQDTGAQGTRVSRWMSLSGELLNRVLDSGPSENLLTGTEGLSDVLRPW